MEVAVDPTTHADSDRTIAICLDVSITVQLTHHAAYTARVKTSPVAWISAVATMDGAEFLKTAAQLPVLHPVSLTTVTVG
jgi:hypothetical protein